MRKLFLLISFYFLSSWSFAEPTVYIAHAWIRWLPGDTPAAGYFDLNNAGKSALELVAVNSPRFAQIHLHRSLIQSGVASMEMVRTLTIQPNSILHFAPRDLHLMLMRPNKPIKIGEQIPLSLHFSNGSSVVGFFTVKGLQ